MSEKEDCWVLTMYEPVRLRLSEAERGVVNEVVKTLARLVDAKKRREGLHSEYRLDLESMEIIQRGPRCQNVQG